MNRPRHSRRRCPLPDETRMREKFQQVFLRSPAGKKVLNHLLEAFGALNFTSDLDLQVPHQLTESFHAYKRGQRSVLDYILMQINWGNPTFLKPEEVDDDD